MNKIFFLKKYYLVEIVSLMKQKYEYHLLQLIIIQLQHHKRKKFEKSEAGVGGKFDI